MTHLYPCAAAFLETARAHRVNMATTWSESLGDKPMTVSVVVNPDGTGRILAHARLGPEERRELTEAFAACVDALWAALDALVTESVEMFSVLQSPRDADRPRFFPVAGSVDGFHGLLDQSCMDGILSAQAEMITDCQPFRKLADGHPARQYQQSLRYLVAWGSALDRGEQVGAWATPAEPQIHVEPPMALVSLVAADAGELTENFTVAKFAISGHTDGDDVDGQAGTYVDLGFAPEFDPSSLDDTLNSRLSYTFDAVTGFLLTFTNLADAVPGAKRILAPSPTATQTQWRDTSVGSRPWGASELAILAASDLGLGVVTETDELTFLVSTAAGVFERVISDATPLRSLDRNGIAAEKAVQDAASTWGLPDFVFSPAVERKGSGVREIGDGLIVVGNHGAIIQVKTREVEPRTPERETAWVKKQIAIARDQVRGTARRIASKPTSMVNGRGRTITFDGSAINWVGVVIVEHPAPPAITVDPVEIGMPYVVLLRRDWEFLFSQLRSTYAVVEYLQRVAIPTEVLGEEPHRYFELARADALVEPRQTDSRTGNSKVLDSTPLLPTAPVGQDELEAHGMVRRLLEDIALSEIGDNEESVRQRVLASIDSLPVGYRTDLGGFLLAGLAEVRGKPASTGFWKSRTFLSEEGRDQLGFAVSSTFSGSSREVFNQWLLTRHDQRRSFENIGDATSIGVLITPRSDGHGEWHTTMSAVHGDMELTEDERRLFDDMWGAP